MTTPNIDTKALRELRDDACNLNGRSLMEVLHAQQKYERAIIAAAPALLDLADRAQGMEATLLKNGRDLDYLLRGNADKGVKLCDALLELQSVKAERDTLDRTVTELSNGMVKVADERDALKAEVERLTAEREDLLKSRDRVIAERNEQSGLRDKLIERMTASDETWSEALGNERKLRDASEREAERLREALTTIDEAFAEGGFFDDGFARSTIRAALRGEEAPRE